ncbi:MAG: hypothetical protein ABI876_04310, partial [Bacteroidota bacterium]
TWYLSRVVYSDRNTVFIIGGREPGISPLILRTTDGGAHWDRMTLAADLDYYTLSDISFPTPKIGYLAGNNYEGRGSVVAKTTDGGLTWNRANRDEMGGYNYYLDFRDSVYGLLANGFAEPAYSTLRITSDGGETWRSVDPAQWRPSYGRSTPSSISHTFDGAWIASSTEDIARSTDDGASWEDATYTFLDDRHSFTGFAFASNDVGYALSEPFALRKLWKTVDGGRSWSAESYNEGEYYNACSAPSDSVAYVVGSAGMIIKKGAESDEANQVNAMRVFPQPVTESARFEFLARDFDQTLHVFNVRGEDILQVPVAAFATTATLSPLPSGVYWCRLGELNVQFFSVR